MGCYRHPKVTNDKYAPAAEASEHLLSLCSSTEGMEADAARAAWLRSVWRSCSISIITLVLDPPNKQGTHLQH